MGLLVLPVAVAAVTVCAVTIGSCQMQLGLSGNWFTSDIAGSCVTLALLAGVAWLGVFGDTEVLLKVMRRNNINAVRPAP